MACPTEIYFNYATSLIVGFCFLRRGTICVRSKRRVLILYVSVLQKWTYFSLYILKLVCMQSCIDSITVTVMEWLSRQLNYFKIYIFLKIRRLQILFIIIYWDKVHDRTFYYAMIQRTRMFFQQCVCISLIAVKKESIAQCIFCILFCSGCTKLTIASSKVVITAHHQYVSKSHSNCGSYLVIVIE